MKAEPIRLIPQKLTANLYLLIVQIHQSKNLTMWYKTPWFCRAVEFFVLLVASTHYVAKTMTHLNVALPQCVGI